MKQKVLKLSYLLILITIITSCATQQSALNRFSDYQRENPSCRYYAGAIMIDDNPTVGGNTDDWGWDSSFGGVNFGCGNSLEEAKKNAIDACDYGAHGLLGKLTEVMYLGLLDFPCKVAFTEENSNPAYVNEGPKKECEKLGYSSGTEKYNECVETLNEK